VRGVGAAARRVPGRRHQGDGYVTPQARYSAIRGGDYVVTHEQAATTPEEGTCTLPGEPTCDALALYEGRCS
jgi:putative hemolysin